MEKHQLSASISNTAPADEPPLICNLPSPTGPMFTKRFRANPKHEAQGLRTIKMRTIPASCFALQISLACASRATFGIIKAFFILFLGIDNNVLPFQRIAAAAVKLQFSRGIGEKRCRDHWPRSDEMNPIGDKSKRCERGWSLWSPAD